MSGAMPQHYRFIPARLLGGAGGDSYFQGSTLFKAQADRWGIELDQINFLFCEVVGIVLGSCIRIFLPAHDRRNVGKRLLCCGLIGVFMAFFSFGLRALYLWAVTTLCFMISQRVNPRYSHLIVFVVSVGYLSYLHIYRMLRDYGGYSLDITMPMMVIVQKITAFAFAVHDGSQDPKKLLPEQTRHAVRTVPGYWVFCSYVFSFQSLMCGPFCFFDEYMDYVEGRCVSPSSYKKTDEVKSATDTDGVSDGEILLPPPQFHPSPLVPVLRKVIAAIILCYVHVTLGPGVQLEILTEENKIRSLTFMQLMFYLLIATTFVRLKYYVAWLLSDAVANASGLGFNGYDELGKPKWDLVSNVDIVEFEFSTNLRGAIAAWNTCTARWLRFVAYDRAAYAPMLATYCLSAFWHGFYPGYYVTFLSGALFTEAGRWGRRVFRPSFQKWRSTRIVYDFITFLITRICLAYLTFPFVLLEIRHAWTIYTALYFWFHIVAVLAVVGLPRFVRRSSSKPELSLGQGVKEQISVSQINLPSSSVSPGSSPKDGDVIRKISSKDGISARLVE